MSTVLSAHEAINKSLLSSIQVELLDGKGLRRKIALKITHIIRYNSKYNVIIVFTMATQNNIHVLHVYRYWQYAFIMATTCTTATYILLPQ